MVNSSVNPRVWSLLAGCSRRQLCGRERRRESASGELAGYVGSRRCNKQTTSRGTSQRYHEPLANDTSHERGITRNTRNKPTRDVRSEVNSDSHIINIRPHRPLNSITCPNRIFRQKAWFNSISIQMRLTSYLLISMSYCQQ